MGGEPMRAMGMLTGAEVTGIDQQFQMLRMEVLTRVAGGVAHDLNNVLCSVIANASFIRMEKNLSSECDELLQEIERSGIAAANLARQLLKLSRAETTAEAPVRLPVLIRECVEVALKGTGIRPAFELDEDCAPILAQEGRLRQAVVYLIIR
jgi:two-component system, cell cycle sensor histidine kinase and response regulator CckA